MKRVALAWAFQIGLYRASSVRKRVALARGRYNFVVGVLGDFPFSRSAIARVAWMPSGVKGVWIDNQQRFR